jgi:hypothetical protein
MQTPDNWYFSVRFLANALIILSGFIALITVCVVSVGIMHSFTGDLFITTYPQIGACIMVLFGTSSTIFTVCSLENNKHSVRALIAGLLRLKRVDEFTYHRK